MRPLLRAAADKNVEAHPTLAAEAPPPSGSGGGRVGCGGGGGRAQCVVCCVCVKLAKCARSSAGGCTLVDRV
jgi:hypothetical protein